MAGILKNLFWKFSERISVQVVSLVVNIIIARILVPEDYGIIAIVSIFTSLSYVIVDGGFNAALIQKKNADAIDFSTVFYFTIVISSLLYCTLYMCAPIISEFYDNKYVELTPVLRVLGVQIIIYGINSIQIAYVSRQLLFKNLFYSSLIGTTLSAVIGVAMAYLGYGVWAIVAQQLGSSTINTITLLAITRKIPKVCFSLARLKSLLNYGVKLFGVSVLIVVSQEIRAIIIGKFYSAKELALYDRGRQFPFLLVNNINTSIGSVLFPEMSKKQDNKFTIKNYTRKSIRFSSFLMSPLMLVMAVCAEPLIRFILTDKWVGCVPLMQLFCIVYLFQPIHTANIQALKAIGKSDVCLKLEIIKKLIELVALILVMNISVKAIVVNMAILTTLFTVINAYPNVKILNYTLKEQMRDILPPILLSLILSLPLYYLNKILLISDLMKLIIVSSIGVLSYIGISKILHNEELNYFETLIKTKVLYGKK